ncbi:hypothetical protein JOF56_000009 [Kibdelosporangium banguiense]|uniref:Uncharacterized protein n=1 Tax=Kibdelosporangium banguiense TaxID=1365924 RepID=A0ABS4T579_9PSEU|nr:hypothetical protein [Kibdelosporangium banguiense]MBP2319624.1 hypothetical protein [Kibdelosporangium banguiense]
MDAQDIGDRLGQQLLVGQRGQLDQPHPARERPAHLGGHSQGQSGLADPGHPGQRDQPHPPQQPRGKGDLPPATDKTGHLARQIPHRSR